MLRKLEPVLRGSEQKQIILDMTSVQRCSATGITILAAAMQHLYQEGRVLPESLILLPRHARIRRYFEYMEFFKELKVGGMDDAIDEGTLGSPLGFRPVTHVPDERTSPSITRDIVKTVEEYHSVDSEAVNALKSCVNEIIENVFYHASSPIDALIAAQAYPRTKKTELVIADTGRGIRPALTEVEEYRERATNDCAAIKLALKKNVTTTGDEGRGIGLWLAAELVRRNGGEMLILSNEGGIDICGDEISDIEGYFWPGTLVAVEFDMTKPISTRQVYDSGEFADVESFDF